MTEETALPQGAPAEASEQNNAAAEQNEQQAGEQQAQAESGEQAGEGEGKGEQKEAKKEKTPEQREIDRLRRRVDNLTRQKYELRANAPQQQQQQNQPQNDDEPVTLSRAELQRYIAEQAQQLAPAVTEQQAEIQRRQGVVASLAKTWGQEEFDAKASELDEVFDGLKDRSGKPKPATDAIFEAENPKEVIEYLTDPDNADEAERISKMTAVQAGRAIARLEDKLTAEKAKAKPKPSNAPKPIETARGGGVPNGMPNPADTKAYIAWANAQERAQR